MNAGGAILLIFVVIVAVLGGFVMASKLKTTPVSDTYGTMPNASVNGSQSAVTNLSATAPSVGGGVALIAVGVILAVILGVLVFLFARGGSGRGYTRSRYH